MSDDGAPRLARTKTEYVLPDDRDKILGATLFVVGPAFAIWCRLWHSWYARLTPELKTMRAGVAAFAKQHRIELSGERPIELEAFKKARDAWVRGLFDSEAKYKRTFEKLRESGEVSEPTSVAVATSVTIAVLYALLFLPDASIFLSKETKLKAWVRVPLSAVANIRRAFVVLLLWQLYAMYSCLGTAFSLACAMEDSVKALSKANIMLLSEPDKYDPAEYTITGLDSLLRKRWGVRFKFWPISPEDGWAIDRLFLADLRMNGLLITVVLSVGAYALWEYIREERQRQGKSSRSLYEKLVGEQVRKRNEELEESHEQLKGELETTRSKLARAPSVGSRMAGLDGDTIPYSLLKFDEEIGSGGYGVVFKGRWRDVDVAIKCIEMHQSDMKRVEMEAAMFLTLKHPHLVNCYGMSEQPAMSMHRPHLCIVTELCKQSLQDVLYNPKFSFKDETMLKWMRQIASGMGYLHSHKIWHRDLKSENVLIDTQKNCKICDYGLSKLMVGDGGSGSTARPLSSRAKGTPDYMPPEVLAGQPGVGDSGMASDVYSYGILLNEMASRERPWAHVESVDGRMAVITNVVANLGKRPTFARNLEPGFQSLVEECWAQDPAQRPAFDADNAGESEPEPELESGMPPQSVIARLSTLRSYRLAVAAVPADGTIVREPEPEPTGRLFVSLSLSRVG